MTASSHRTRRAEHARPPLRVIEGGRAQLIADIETVAENLRELEAREELRRLLASLGPISMTMSWRR
jgi:hypothetical protein